MTKRKFLLQIHEILNDFEKELSDIKLIIERYETDILKLEPPSEYWRKKHAKMWLHGATEIADCNALEAWLFASPPLTKTAQLPATKIRRAWRKWLKTQGGLDGFGGRKGAYYVDDPRFKIPKCKKRRNTY